MIFQKMRQFWKEVKKTFDTSFTLTKNWDFQEGLKQTVRIRGVENRWKKKKTRARPEKLDFEFARPEFFESAFVTPNNLKIF